WWSGKQSRSQKKSRKAMLKLEMKAVLGVNRVTIKRTKNVSSCCILLRPKELQVPLGSVSLLQWVGSSVGNVGDPTCSLCKHCAFIVTQFFFGTNLRLLCSSFADDALS
ncbi:nascent polypeptide-associated complex subunit alpha-like protein 2, partial [Tanacetum coccineum]